jgi:phage head maturation protease
MSAAPAYCLDPGPARVPSWFMGDRAEYEEYLDTQSRLRFVSTVEPVRFDTGVGGAILEGRMVPYLEWAEIRSPAEGHFLERWMPGALSEQIRSGIGRTQLLFDHGVDNQFGRMPLGRITSLRDMPDGAYFRATLFAGIPELLMSSLRAGCLGSSVRFTPVEVQREKFPRRSDYNPTALPEQSVLSAELREVSITPFAAYRGATAQIVEATA